MNNEVSVLTELLRAASEGVEFALTYAFDMRGEYNWGIRPRVIDDDMLVFSRGGNGYYDIDGTRYPLKRGRFLFISHGTRHSSGQTGFEFASVLALRYRPIDRATGGDASARCPVCDFIWDCGDVKFYESLFQSVYKNRADAGKGGQSALLLHYSITSIFAQLLSDITAAGRSDGCDIIDFKEKVRAYVDARIRDSAEIEPDKLAARLGMPRSIFYRRFHEICRVSFREYVYERRMACAAYLLAATDMKVKQIAAHLGYSDQYIFANMFKKFYGVPPGSYTKYYPG